ncbi:MAG: HAMP domain-containing protein [Alphaproteobacteria bacterium]|nr:HAMP domain-containing protein [Alphaproteobacteria bacterium]
MAFSIKNILPRSLFGRSLLILVTPVLLIQIISSYIFIDQHWSKMADRLSFAVAGEIAVIADQVERGTDPERISRLSGFAVQYLDMLVSFDAADVMAQKPARLRSTVVEKTLGRALEWQVRRPYNIHVDIHEKWVQVDVQLENGVLRVSVPQRRLFSSTGYIFLLWMIGTSIVMLAIAILFMRNQIRPIRRLAVVAERFGKGREIPASFKPEGAYEIRQAARAFLAMHERIKRQMQQRTAMLAGVSHDLRTPLTRMKLQAAMLPPGADVEALKGDISDMELMLNSYLDFVRGEGGEQAVRTDLREILDRVAVGMKRQGAQMTMEAQGDLSMPLRPVAFERCLTNLVNNARKYAKTIAVTAERNDDVIQIQIDDDGPGIPADKYEDVFKPFFRVEGSRNPSTGGVGLGLPIAQDIVHSHGGEITLEQSQMGGLRVTIRVPV